MYPKTTRLNKKEYSLHYLNFHSRNTIVLSEM